MESYEKIKKVLALGFMNFLDGNKAKGKMCLSNGECEDIEKAFNEQDWPKLARYLDKYTESEDERMMREFNDWLCEEIECRTNDLRDEKDRKTLNMLCFVLKKVDAWLEKQKESLHIQESCKENADSFTDKDERTRKELVNFILYNKVSRVLLDKETEHRFVAYLQRQKEQKPVQDKEEKEYVRTLKSLIADFLRGKDEIDRGYYQKIYDWLDGRHIEQKPAEWSEEDEKQLDDIISIIREAYEHGITISETRHRNAYSWLNNLRPSWKPSEEQMNALNFAITYMFSTKANPTVLRDLYDDLLKLNSHDQHRTFSQDKGRD